MVTLGTKDPERRDAHRMGLGRMQMGSTPLQVVGVGIYWNELATEPSRQFRYFVATEPLISLFLSFMPTKDLAPFLYIPHKKPSFKPINDQFIVTGICWVQLNQPTFDFGW